MLEYAHDALAFTSGKTREDLANDKVLAFAITRAVKVIGEAANYVSSEFQAAHPHIPWRQMVGACNHLIHGYFAVDLEIVWQTVTESLPPLIAALEKLVGDETT